MTLSAILLLALTAVLLPGAPVKRDNRKLESAFQGIERAVAADVFAGAVALVAEKGKVVREAAYGVRDIENGLPFQPDTICWIASITKPVTAAAVMKLVEAGRLRLDEPLDKYLPEFRNQPAPDGLHYPITIRHVLTHSSGILENPPNRKQVFTEDWTGKTIAETLSPIAATTLRFVPGTQVQYSNAAYFALGRVIEVASGKPYADYVKQAILDPLGMHESYFITALPAREAKRTAVTYLRRAEQRTLHYRFDPGQKRVNGMPDGGLFCTARDLLKFYQMFLDGGAGILSARSVREMLTEHAPGRGLGWSLRHGGFSHGGSSGAYGWGDPASGVVGLLLLQDNDQFDSPRNFEVVRARSQFVHAVQAAYGDRSASPAFTWPIDRPWTLRSKAASIQAVLEAPSGRKSTVAGAGDLHLSFDEAGIWRVTVTSDPLDPRLQSDFALEILAKR